MTRPIPHLGNPSDTTIKEYVIVLKDFNDSEMFYLDMETPGGNLYIPERSVDCVNRFPESRGTGYMLTYQEAAEIMNDPRVLAVELNLKDLGFEIRHCGFTFHSDNFDKSVTPHSTDINWGLLRATRKADIAGWGAGGTITQSADITVDCSGKNVDVVISDDSHPYPTILEYQQNSDGTGYSRMVEYPWNQGYDYYRSTTGHASHVSGVAAGNTQGWARDANIYNISSGYLTNPVKSFHLNKPINPLTGVKNPTILNCSWGLTMQFKSADISLLTIRGVDYHPTSGTAGTYVWDDHVLRDIARLPSALEKNGFSAWIDANIMDTIDVGVIVVVSAGNYRDYCDVKGGEDYDNTMVLDGTSYYIHRGMTPMAGSNDSGTLRAVCVGSTGWGGLGDYKSPFSNYGPRIDCYAPGYNIMSIYEADINNPPVIDPRVDELGLTDTTNNNLRKMSGTSQAAPQVTGILACLAEKYPTMTQLDALSFIKTVSPSVMLSTDGGSTDPKDAGFSFNPASNKQMVLMQGTRVPSTDSSGLYSTPYPTVLSWYRPITGHVYPRRRLRQTTNVSATFALSANSHTVSTGGSVVVTLATTNIPAGTPVQYIITANLKEPLPVIYTTTKFSGVCSVSSLINGTTLDTHSHTGNRLLTTSSSSGMVTTIPNAILGAAALSQSTYASPGGLQYTGDDWDGYWEVPLPFNITYLDTTYSKFYVSTNLYVTFELGSVFSNPSESVPALRKIVISSSGFSTDQTLYHGVEGSAPNRTYRIRHTGTTYVPELLNRQPVEYEIVFYENNPAQIDIQIGENGSWVPTTSGSVYPFSYADVDVPLVGDMIINNNTATLPITVSSTDELIMSVRLGIFPTPSVNITVN